MKYITILLIIAFVFGIGYYYTQKPAEENLEEEKTVTEDLFWTTPPAMEIDAAKTYEAVMKTSKGDMRFKLFADENPITVNNFVFLSRKGFYDETKFHRIIKTFMIQGGDPQGTGMGGPGYKFADEPVTRDYNRGILAMANSGPNTNGSQFFIMHADNALPKNYIIFGELIEGLESLDAIADTPVGPNNFGEVSVPDEDVLVTGVEIIEK